MGWHEFKGKITGALYSRIQQHQTLQAQMLHDQKVESTPLKRELQHLYLTALTSSKSFFTVHILWLQSGLKKFAKHF